MSSLARWAGPVIVYGIILCLALMLLSAQSRAGGGDFTPEQRTAPPQVVVVEPGEGPSAVTVALIGAAATIGAAGVAAFLGRHKRS